MRLIDFFDDRNYLAAHPDLDRVHKAGKLPSGLAHYILHGASEGRRAPHDERLTGFLKARTLEAVPPDHLIFRVHGSGGRDTFIRTGKLLAFDLDNCMQMAGIDLPDGANVLDFGCGPGRVMQWFAHIHPNVYLHGCDIDPDPIRWADAHLPGLFAVNAFDPPLPYEEKTFDLVYSVSVFTHLPEAMQFAWLDELRRVTKPGGYLLLSVHGANLATKRGPLPEHEQSLETDGFLYRKGGGVSGLPDFYQNTFHTVEYIHRHWSNYFDVRFVLKRGLNGHQDLVVCKVT